jgi:hypothetical protein
MSANGETAPQGTSEIIDKGKGKGKAVEDLAPAQAEEDSDEESGVEEVLNMTPDISFQTYTDAFHNTATRSRGRWYARTHLATQ